MDTTPLESATTSAPDSTPGPASRVSNATRAQSADIIDVSPGRRGATEGQDQQSAPQDHRQDAGTTTAAAATHTRVSQPHRGPSGKPCFQRKLAPHSRLDPDRWPSENLELPDAFKAQAEATRDGEKAPSSATCSTIASASSSGATSPTASTDSHSTSRSTATAQDAAELLAQTGTAVEAGQRLEPGDTVDILVGPRAGDRGIVAESGADGRYEVDDV